MMNSPQYIPWSSNALSMPFPAKNRHRKITDFSRFREIVTLFEIINDPKARDWPLRYVLSVLFVIEGLEVMVILQLIDKWWF